MPSNAALGKVAVVVAGVLLAGAILRYGYENDIPGVKYAANGFGSNW